MLAYSETIPAPETLMKSFKGFSSVAGSLLHIHNKKVHQKALDTLEMLLETAPEDADAPEHGLIDLLAGAIERYESSIPEYQAFESEVASMDSGVSMLRLLMQNHGLIGLDFEHEIGKRSYVSLILSGERRLTREHIEKLSKRFNISPALFF